MVVIEKRSFSLRMPPKQTPISVRLIYSESPLYLSRYESIKRAGINHAVPPDRSSPFRLCASSRPRFASSLARPFGSLGRPKICKRGEKRTKPPRSPNTQLRNRNWIFESRMIIDDGQRPNSWNRCESASRSEDRKQSKRNFCRLLRRDCAIKRDEIKQTKSR